MAVTAKDVAKLVGLSQQSVSRILGNAAGYSFSPETRERVLNAAAELRYRPNAAARGLRRARLDTIGVSLHSLGRLAICNPYGNQVLQGIVQAAHDASYNVTHVHQPWNEASGSIDGFRSDLVDGMVLIAPGGKDKIFADLADRGVPVVAVSAPGEACGIPTVDVDNVRGTRMIMEHLLQLGHRRIAHLTYRAPRYDAVQRREAFHAMMSEAGLPVPPEYIQVQDTHAIEAYTNPDVIVVYLDSEMRFEYYEPTRYLLTLPERPTAIFACDDRVARDVLQAARDLGISVPDQLSVVSFDDIPEAARMDPPLTTIRQPLAEMGAAAARLLIAILGGEEAVPKTHWFEPNLIIRKSTARAPEDTV